MIRKFIITFTFSFCLIFSLQAEKVNISTGFHTGYIPSMGGNLDSYNQRYYFDSNSGIDGINKKMDGYSTSDIGRLIGIFGGIEVKAVFFDYYLFRIGANYGMSIIGGNGNTVFYSANTGEYYILKCEYSYKIYDFPITMGISIPYWKDARISISCGAALASATYENKFESETTPANFERKGSFSGWSFPLIVLFQGDYFFTQKIALTSSIYYYRGSTEVIKDSVDSDSGVFDIDGDGNTEDGVVDFASIDFTGYRFSLGISYYFYSL